jgi:hypothetical protein
MKRFKQYLAEGGNISFASGATAAPFPVTAKTRPNIQNEVHQALASIHDSFHKETGLHLFGKDKSKLHDLSVYSGSSHSLMNNEISHEEFGKHKPSVGDIDAQVSRGHKDALAKHLKEGDKHGNFEVVGVKKHGVDTSIGLRHNITGHVHQVDFEGVEHPGSVSSRFLHSSDWEDTKQGIKGLHHKILLNAVGGDKYKHSIAYGLRSRTDPSDPGSSHPTEVSRKLFGNDADHRDIGSFRGVAKLIKKHIPKNQHQAIFDKFVSGLPSKGVDHGPAINLLQRHLGVKRQLKEGSNGESGQHAHAAFMGASPFTHMGHHIDVVGGMSSGPKFVGLSGKSDLLSDSEREGIANKQSGGAAEFKVEKSAGQTVGRAFNSMRGPGKKILHLHFGRDREQMAERLKSSIQAGKIPELGGKIPDEVHIHYPKDENRTHGMSGTRMRQAAAAGDIREFHRHLGDKFSPLEAGKMMRRVRGAINAGTLEVNR